MRATLTIDDDLAGLLKERARELGIAFDQAVNQAIRAGIGELGQSRFGTVPKTIPHSFGFKSKVDLDKLNGLADDLECEAYAASLRRLGRPARRQSSRSRP